jgi:hypothetical protein
VSEANGNLQEVAEEDSRCRTVPAKILQRDRIHEMNILKKRSESGPEDILEFKSSGYGNNEDGDPTPDWACDPCGNYRAARG